MYKLSVLYDHGYGRQQDYVRARRWYEKAAGAGNAHAQASLKKLPKIKDNEIGSVVNRALDGALLRWERATTSWGARFKIRGTDD